MSSRNSSPHRVLRNEPRQVLGHLRKVPSWVIILVLMGLTITVAIFGSQTYQQTFLFLSSGVLLTVYISVAAFVAGIPIGLVAALGRTSKSHIFRPLATLYVQVVRGIPMLVLVLYVGFAVTPAVARWLGVKNASEPTRAIIALACANGAFLAEIFRGGMKAVSGDQMEAARSLGMTYFQAMRYVILPQAIRFVLPPLGNNFISILKNSSLASVLAIRELTHMGRINIGVTFDTFTTWNLVALLYLMMTLLLSLSVRFLEHKAPLE